MLKIDFLNSFLVNIFLAIISLFFKLESGSNAFSKNWSLSDKKVGDLLGTFSINAL